MLAAVVGISLGVVFGYLSFRHEEYLFGTAGFLAVMEVLMHGGQALFRSKAGLGASEDWAMLVLVAEVIPPGVMAGALWFFVVLFLTRAATWAWLQANHVCPDSLPPECPDTFRARVLAEYGYTEKCIRKLNARQDAFHARWGG